MSFSPILKSFKHTRFACYLCFIIQAIVINFTPILFVTFSDAYNIPLAQITFLIIANFSCQFIIDSISAALSSRLNYRVMVVSANLFAAAGLVCLGILPSVFDNAYLGIVISVLVSAVGGGLIEVIANPIMQSCPKENSFESMGLLHSFYCWGHLFVVTVSTLFLLLSDNWQLLSCVWALVPLFNGIYFLMVPINQPSVEQERDSSLKKLVKNKMFWLFIVIMLLGGACEQGMAQWASAFAELALLERVASAETAKLLGDLMGPCSFALMMGICRILYPKLCTKYDLRKLMVASAGLCAVCYVAAALSQNPFVALIGCGICGFSVGIMWPGALDLATLSCSFVGTALFAMMSLAGDIGCMFGPSAVGLAADAIGNGDLKVGMLISAIIPTCLAIVLLCFRSKNKQA